VSAPAPRPGVLTLYGNSGSGNCLKVKWVATLLKTPYEWIEVDTFAGGTRTEDFLSINPAGQVPAVILPDGRALAQSNAIMLHLAETAHSALIPRDAYARARMYEWLFWEQYSHEPTIAVRRAQLFFLHRSEDEIDPELLNRGRRALGRMELGLLGSDYLVGEALTLADIALVAYTRVAHEGGYDLSEFPAVRAWVRRVERDLGLTPVEEAA
jgi:glutathione S-transferase